MPLIPSNGITIHFPGESKVTRISREQYEAKVSSAKEYDFAANNLIGYKASHHQLKYKGKSKVDSIDAYVLELTYNNTAKTKMTYYINTRSNLIYKVEGVEGARYYANYTTIGNYVYPRFMHSTTENMPMTILLDKIDIGITLSDTLFAVPKNAINQEEVRQKRVAKITHEADSLFSIGEYERSGRKYAEALSLDPNNASLIAARGIIRMKLQKYYEAVSDLNEAIELDSTIATSFNNRGLSKYFLGDNYGALKDYTAALRRDSVFVAALKNRGLVYIDLKQYDLAANDFKKAVRLAPDNGDAVFKYGVALAQLKRYEEAVRAYQKAAELNYASAEFYNYFGVALFRLEQFEKALELFKKANESAPNNIQYLENVGNSLYRLERYRECSAWFEKCIKQEETGSSYNMLGLCKYQEENFKGAIKDFSKAIELAPKNAEYYDNRAAAKKELEDYEGAILDYSQSISLYPNDPSVFYKRGLIKIRTSKKLEGCMDLGTANEMKYEPAKKAIIKNCN